MRCSLVSIGTQKPASVHSSVLYALREHNTILNMARKPRVDRVVELSLECIDFSDKSDLVMRSRQVSKSAAASITEKLAKLTVANPGKTILR